VLWWGKVLEGSDSTDADARSLHALNTDLHADPRVENLILPLRDGIHALRVK